MEDGHYIVRQSENDLKSYGLTGAFVTQYDTYTYPAACGLAVVFFFSISQCVHHSALITTPSSYQL